MTDRNGEIRIPEQAERILDILQAAGFEAFVVGGCVRDCLLGRKPVDWDITTSALPSEVKSLFCRTVDTGIEHGTVMVLMGGTGYEVTTYRKDGKYSDSRRPDEVEFTPSLEEDLKRRDFTINAFAYNHERGLVDLFNGIADLEEGIIRCVGDPNRRFSEDALRIMRAVRFAAQLSFTIEPATYAAIRDHAENLSRISMERIRVEFEKTLLSENPSYVNLFQELGLAEYIIQKSKEEPAAVRKEPAVLPDCAAETGTPASRCFLEESVALYRQMTMEKLREGADKNKIRYLRLAAFFCGLSPEEAGGAMRRLTYDNQTRKMVKAVLKNKDVPILPDRKLIKRALNSMGQEVLELVLAYKKAAILADTSIKSGEMRCFEMREEQLLDDAIEVAEEVIKSGEPYKISMLAVNGNDIIENGIAQGAEVGAVLERLLQIVIDDPKMNRKDRLLSL